MYKVILVPAGCGQSALDVKLVESNANKMSEQGYELIQAYQTSTVGCLGTKSACVLIFRQVGK